MRLGAPDNRIEYNPRADGEVLLTDLHVPAGSPDLIRRIAGHDTVSEIEGMPLLHVTTRVGKEPRPGWRDWFFAFRPARDGGERGPSRCHARLAIESAKQDVGFTICGLAMIEEDLAPGRCCFPAGRLVA